MELIDRKSALDAGLKTYFTGIPCKHGHISARKVSGGNCTECAKLVTRKWRERGGSSQEFNLNGKQLPDLEYLQECFEYNEDGSLTWKVRPISHFKNTRTMNAFNSNFAGKIAGHYHTRNFYLEVRVGDKLYKGHRIIWKLCKKEEPEGIVDHIDGDPGNNRIENLRLATAQENSRNSEKRANRKRSTSDYKGVYYRKGRWCSCLTIDDEVYIKRFSTELEAALDYDKRALEAFGEFAKLNFPEGANDV